ncbi:unnamed protein product [Urochloa decumbens]|uniref:Disease resistance protein At4g27190-like leucine-rich repeats domain-containing protein n=1 Tax=Urochloa decumbens TaxID=240449 RepID=A0ABC9B5K2_9POAL
MRTKVITAYTIDRAAQQIIEELKEDAAGTARGTTASSSRRNNVIYFDGWYGLGASEVLREVGRRLTPAASPSPAGRRRAPAATGPEFSQIFHIDCSKWESRRAMQRTIAEQLELPTRVMDMLDAQDEEDDYKGIAKGYRDVIQQVAEETGQHIQKLNRRFLVIFHNGSNEEINLDSFGFPLSGYSGNKVLWSFQGRFRLYPRTKVDRALESTRTTDVVLSVGRPRPCSFDILIHEAAEVAREVNIDWTAEAVANCFMYMIQLHGMGNGFDDYDLATHGFNYWICDGIVQLQQKKDIGGTADEDGADRLWLSCYALQREMRLDADYYQKSYLTSPVAILPMCIPYWTSPSYGFMQIPADQDGHGRIPEGLFQRFNNVSVLKLSACRFSFTSPPFLCCHSLRFLWLDNCQDEISLDDEAGKEEDIRRCFQRLWVLDMRWSSSTFLSAKMMGFMTQLRELNVTRQSIDDMAAFLQVAPHNVRRLRVMNSYYQTTGARLRSDLEIPLFRRDKMELLDLSKNCTIGMKRFLVSSCSSLETLIVDESDSLEVIHLERCSKLKNPLFSGDFFELRTLRLIGCEAVEILDLSAVAAPELDELTLLDCGKLRAIMWPPAAEDKRKRYLDKLCIGTTQEEGTAARGIGISPTDFDWYVSVRDARLLGSLEPVKGPNHAHVEISTLGSSSSARPCAEDYKIKNSIGQHVVQLLQDNATYADVAGTFNKDTSMQQQEANSDACWAIMCACPPPPYLTPHGHGCYIHVQDQMTRTRQQSQTAGLAVPGFICDDARILDVHDSLFVTSILAAPVGSRWNQLEWCRVERCPKLECVFGPGVRVEPGQRGDPDPDPFSKLRTIWVSHLPSASSIFEHNIVHDLLQNHKSVFGNLTLLHLHCCPRMKYAVPLSVRNFGNLETLEITWCDDLTWVFQPFYFANAPVLPRLKRIRLHELPMLQGFSTRGTTFAPDLQTIKIRGCWSLNTLPEVGGKNLVECDCEKEWWDKLKWSTEVQKNYYKPTHPRYYKKTMLRGSPLR